MLNKKGDESLTSFVIFLVLNLMFFSAMFIFVTSSGENSAFYEQKYSKEIALIVDSSYPGMQVSINVTELGDFISDKNIPPEEIFKIGNGEVRVKLSDSSYSYPIFSDYEIEQSIEAGNDGKIKFLKLNIK
jgi:hypothetical protein